MTTRPESVIDRLDIISTSKEYPASELSNFTYYEFTVDGVKCCSMEGFLQSLKFKNERAQRQICRLYGKKAKLAPSWFRNHIWRLTGILYWKGESVCRYSDKYQLLLDKAYNQLYRNKRFRKALLASSNKQLTHSIGKRDQRRTVLTEYEFITRLNRLRAMINE